MRSTGPTIRSRQACSSRESVSMLLLKADSCCGTPDRKSDSLPVVRGFFLARLSGGGSACILQICCTITTAHANFNGYRCKITSMNLQVLVYHFLRDSRTTAQAPFAHCAHTAKSPHFTVQVLDHFFLRGYFFSAVDPFGPSTLMLCVHTTQCLIAVSQLDGQPYQRQYQYPQHCPGGHAQ